MNKVTSTIAVLAIGLIALIAYVVVTNQTGVEEDVNFQPQEVMMEEMSEENTSVNTGASPIGLPFEIDENAVGTN